MCSKYLGQDPYISWICLFQCTRYVAWIEVLDIYMCGIRNFLEVGDYTIARSIYRYCKGMYLWILPTAKWKGCSICDQSVSIAGA